jgi:Ca2+-binding EF-hand superfamily protein
MQRVADGMSLETSDLNGDGLVSKEEFLTGTDIWFEALDKDGDGGITMADFKR